MFQQHLGIMNLKTNGEVVEQIIRPTGLLDPTVEVRPTKNQIDDLIGEIRKQIAKTTHSNYNPYN